MKQNMLIICSILLVACTVSEQAYEKDLYTDIIYNDTSYISRIDNTNIDPKIQVYLKEILTYFQSQMNNLTQIQDLKISEMIRYVSESTQQGNKIGQELYITSNNTIYIRTMTMLTSNSIPLYSVIEAGMLTIHPNNKFTIKDISNKQGYTNIYEFHTLYSYTQPRNESWLIESDTSVSFYLAKKDSNDLKLLTLLSLDDSDLDNLIVDTYNNTLDEGKDNQFFIHFKNNNNTSLNASLI